MKKVVLLISCILTICSLSAQENTQDLLKQHVYTLADKQMKGRALSSPQMKEAWQYVFNQMQSFGYVGQKDGLTWDAYSVSSEDSTQDYIANCYRLNWQNPKDTKNRIVVMANLSGYGCDTIQGHELIKYSADKASSVAVLLELAKELKKIENQLNHRFDFIFYSAIPDEENEVKIATDTLYAKGFENMVIFSLYKLGYQYKDSLGNYNPDGENLHYTYNDYFEDFSNIIHPIILNDSALDVYASNLNDYERLYTSPLVRVSTYSFIEKYDDNAEAMDYPMMEKILRQLKEVVLAVDTAKDLKITKKQESDNSLEEDIDPGFSVPSKMMSKYKHKSYFGINLIWGSNQFDYKKGNTTGKTAALYSAGLFYRQQLNDALALKIDVNYEFAKAKMRNEKNFQSEAISVPITLMLIGLDGRAMYGFDFGVGAYCDYILRGEYDGKPLDFNQFNRYDIGINWDVDLRIGRFIIGYQYKHSYTNKITDLFQPTTKGRICENSSMFKLGFRF